MEEPKANEKALEELNFEEALKRLEEVVQKLEDGEVPLEKAIDFFQEGMQLARLCDEKLGKVEQKIEMLLEEGGDFVKKPFELGDDHE